MPYKHFRPRAGRYGCMVEGVATNSVTAITASTSTTLLFGVPRQKAFIERFAVICGSVAPVYSALTVVISKRRGGTTTALTGSVSLLSLATNTATVIPLLAGLTDGQLTMQEGDILEATITAGTQTTAPTGGLMFTVELMVQE